MNTASLSRRDMFAGLAASAALSIFPARAATVAPPIAATLLDVLAWQLLDILPSQATQLGLDTGAYAAMRGRLEDRSPTGVETNRRFLTEGLTRLAAVARDGLEPTIETSVAVAESAFRTALDGLALPYGDVAIGGWRNTPYVVIQNVGGYLDIPQLLDGDQPLRDAADADAYCARLAATTALLDGELEVSVRSNHPCRAC